jgi:hypothetical protein
MQSTSMSAVETHSGRSEGREAEQVTGIFHRSPYEDITQAQNHNRQLSRWLRKKKDSGSAR